MKIPTLICLLLSATCFTFLLRAQPAMEWGRSFGGSNTDAAYSIEETGDGGSIVVGYSQSNDWDVSGNHGNLDYWIIRLDASGNLIWQKSLGGSNDDIAQCVDQTSDGGFIIAGSSLSTDGDVTGQHGSGDYWVVKLDSLGNLVWQKCFGGSFFDSAFSIEQTNDGGYIVAGMSGSLNGDVSGNHGQEDYWVVKMDSVGNLTWQKSFGGTYSDYGYSVEQTPDEGFIVAGASYSNNGNVTGHHGNAGGPYDADYWAVRLDANGSLLWEKSLGGTGLEKGAMSVTNTTDGGFILAGASYSLDGDVTANHGADDYWIVKLDSTGNLEWQKSYGGSGFDECCAVRQISDGSYILAGRCGYNDGDVSGNHGADDYWVVKIDTIGNLIWQKCLGGTDLEKANSIRQTSDGGLVIAGWSYSYNGDVSGNHGSTDYWIVKLVSDEPQPSPSIEWQKSLGGTLNDEAASVQQTTDGGFIVAGYTASSDVDVSLNHGAEDYWIVRLGIWGDTLWKKSLGGSGSDKAWAVRQTPDGGFIVGGWSFSNDGDVSGNHGGMDYWIVKLDSAGNIAWQKSLGGSSYDNLTSLQLTSDGGFIVAGASGSNDGDVSGNHGNNDYWVVKLDNLGNIIWQKSLGGSSGDYATAIQQTNDGGYIVAGNSWSNDGDVSGNHGLYDYWVIRLDVNGNLVWQKSLGGSDVDYANAVDQADDGGFIVAGTISSNNGDITGNHGGYDIWVVKLTADGNITWQKALGGTNGEQTFSVIQTFNTEFIVGGFSESNNGDVGGNHGSIDYWIVKLGPAGNLLWQKCMGGSGDDNAYSIQEITNGGLIVAGTSASDDGDVSGNHGNFDYWIVKLSCTQPQYFYPDADGDGFGNLNDTLQACTMPAGYVTNSLDCNDASSTIHPGAAETCNGIDDNCINGIDDGLNFNTYYLDADSDWFGNFAFSLASCNGAPAGYVPDSGFDCNDSDPNVYPGAPEIQNGIDDDCDGLTDEICFAGFTLVADTLVPHHYWLLNLVIGVPPISYIWYWGDGSTDTIAYPGHTYASAGYYTICLSIEDSIGCTSGSCVFYELMKSEEMSTIITVNVVDSLPNIPTIIENHNLLQSWSVFPNPASGNSLVTYFLSSPATVSIGVYDVLGSKLYEITNNQEAGEHHSTLNLEKLPDGICFLQIRAGDQMASQKLIIKN